VSLLKADSAEIEEFTPAVEFVLAVGHGGSDVTLITSDKAPATVRVGPEAHYVVSPEMPKTGDCWVESIYDQAHWRNRLLVVRSTSGMLLGKCFRIDAECGHPG
jgi:hypothetical protein